MPRGDPMCRDTAPASPKTQCLQCSTTPRGPFPAAAVGMAKNSQHHLLAATAVLNIAGIDRAAGPAARESGRGAQPPQHGGEAGSERGLRIHMGTAPLSTGEALVQAAASLGCGWGQIPPRGTPRPRCRGSLGG